MRALLDILKDRNFWQGSIQIAVGIFIGLCAIIATIIILASFFGFLGID
tara:strand:+ start:334 stop:480 length:147 start_codon:yes stop_codon:yes gene_type:complete